MNNLSICEDWLLKQKIETHFEGKDKIVKMKYTDLMQLFLDFIKLVGE